MWPGLVHDVWTSLLIEFAIMCCLIVLWYILRLSFCATFPALVSLYPHHQSVSFDEYCQSDRRLRWSRSESYPRVSHYRMYPDLTHIHTTLLAIRDGRENYVFDCSVTLYRHGKFCEWKLCGDHLICISETTLKRSWIRGVFLDQLIQIANNHATRMAKNESLQPEVEHELVGAIKNYLTAVDAGQHLHPPP